MVAAAAVAAADKIEMKSRAWMIVCLSRGTLSVCGGGGDDDGDDGGNDCGLCGGGGVWRSCGLSWKKSSFYLGFLVGWPVHEILVLLVQARFHSFFFIV